MHLNTNFSNNNQNGVSFQASFRTEIPVKNLERLANIKKIFAEKTQHYKADSDILTLSTSKDPSWDNIPILRTTDEIQCEEYLYSHLAPNLDELMTHMSDNQIAKKLIRFFKTMKKEETIDKMMCEFTEQIEHLKSKKRQNLRIANVARDAGNEKTAEIFSSLADGNSKRLSTVLKEQEKTKNRLISDLEKIVKDDSDLVDIPSIYKELS